MVNLNVGGLRFYIFNFNTSKQHLLKYYNMQDGFNVAQCNPI
jgi:hypothetical protein